jgi:hypothetical protein
VLDVNVWTNHLIGRDRELAVLGSLLDEAVVDGATLLLTGEPGVGKTALLAAAAEMAATAGFEVIRAGGVEYETDVSFAGLHQLVGPLSDELHRLPRSSRVAMEVALGLGSGPAPERLAVLNASLALFRQAASRGPLLIVIDDLHWLDRASGAAVGFVGRRLRGSRIGLLGAIRPDVGGFFERAGLPEYEVAPLSEADAMGLLARQFVHLPTRVLRRVADEAQGNPPGAARVRRFGRRPPRRRSTARHRDLRDEPGGADVVRRQDPAARRADAAPAPAGRARRLRQPGCAGGGERAGRTR